MLQRALAAAAAVALMTLLLAGCTPADSPGVGGVKTEDGGLVPSSFMPEVPRISVEEVKARMDAGASMVIVDSRSRGDYESSHVPGAVSLPLEDMAEPYDQFEGFELIVTYCT